ncbi:MAG: phosphonate ABC transporter, permease protein PhnE [Bacillota bacterium]|nr:MAG: phosphonate ABC transporter, permease protein PhnE [Bacillota bacterium]
MSALARRSGTLVAALALVALYVWAIVGLELRGVNLAERWHQAAAIFRIMVTEPEWTYLWKCGSAGCVSELGQKILETLQMALVGTTIGAVLAVPFGFLAARNVAGVRGSRAGKFILNAIRAFPEVVLALMLLKAVGLGPFAGVLTMGIHSIGMLGKLYAEVVEGIDRDVLEAMAACGANRSQAIAFGILPQVLPEFASFAIYRFEINVRAAAILGMVGAGGIGTPLIFAVNNRDWGRIGVILLGIIVVVAAVDAVSSYLRRKLV